MSSPKILSAWATCTVILAVLSSCDSSGTLLERFEPRGSYELAWESLPALEGVTDVRIGGFAGLSYVSGRHFFTVTDRGPVLGNESGAGPERYFIAPDFVPEIVKLSLQDDGSIRILERIPLAAPTGKSTSGLPPPQPWHSNEVFLNDQADASDDWGLNPGGVVLDRENNFFWVSDHYGPGLFQVTVHGAVVRRVRAIEGLRRAYVTRQAGGGFSGVGIEPSGQIVAAMMRPLDNRVDPAHAVNDSLRRIVRFNPNTGEERSLFYMVEPESLDGVPSSEVRIGHLAVIRDNEYLITEHANVEGRARTLLFAVSVPDSSTKARPGLEGIIGKTIETLTEQEWQEAGLISVNKKLVADLSEAGVSRPDGIAIVSSRRVAVLEGNGYGIVNGEPASRTYSIEPRGVRVVIVDLQEDL